MRHIDTSGDVCMDKNLVIAQLKVGIIRQLYKDGLITAEHFFEIEKALKSEEGELQ